MATQIPVCNIRWRHGWRLTWPGVLKVKGEMALSKTSLSPSPGTCILPRKRVFVAVKLRLLS
jgi:hypothetical protein